MEAQNPGQSYRTSGRSGLCLQFSISRSSAAAGRESGSGSGSFGTSVSAEDF